MLRFCLFICVVAMFAIHAPAQYVIEADLQPRVAGGRIVTDAIDDATGDVTPDVGVFGYEFGEDPLEPYFLSDPGFDVESDSGLPPGSVLSFGVLRHLSYWSGGGTGASFGAIPSGEALRLNFGVSNVTIGGASPAQPGFAIGAIAADGTLHRHLNAFLLGADGNADPDDGVVPAGGIYFTAVELISSVAGIENSRAIYLAYNNGAPEPVFDAALAYLAEPVPGDANFDGAVNLDDFNILATNFNTAGRHWFDGDFTGDSVVNLDDFNLLAGNFNSGSLSSIPEPQLAGLMVFGWLLRRYHGRSRREPTQ